MGEGEREGRRVRLVLFVLTYVHRSSGSRSSSCRVRKKKRHADKRTRRGGRGRQPQLRNRLKHNAGKNWSETVYTL